MQSGYEDKLHELMTLLNERRRRFYSLQSKINGIEAALNNALEDALTIKVPLTGEPLVRLSLHANAPEPSIMVNGFDDSYLTFTLQKTSVLNITTDGLEIDAVDYTPKGGGTGMTTVDFVTANGDRFTLFDLLERFFDQMIDNLRSSH